MFYIKRFCLRRLFWSKSLLGLWVNHNKAFMHASLKDTKIAKIASVILRVRERVYNICVKLN